MDKAFLRSDSINGRSGGESPPALAGEDACATIACAKIFNVVYRTFKTGGSGTRVMIALVALAAELARAQIGAGTNQVVAAGATSTNAVAVKAGAAASSLSGYVPDDKYKLRAGDRVAFQIVEDRDAPKSLVVADSGELDIPYIGRAAAVEKTCKQLAGELKGQLEKEYYYRATVVIALDAANKFFGRVYVWGQVRNQGAIDMAVGENLTAGKAILRAGGFADFANKKRVKLVRGGPDGTAKQTFVLNMTEILEEGRTERDTVLKPDDFIIVPSRLVNF
jgi:protein involved in polysaccharide export with SLBB domain